MKMEQMKRNHMMSFKKFREMIFKQILGTQINEEIYKPQTF